MFKRTTLLAVGCMVLAVGCGMDAPRDGEDETVEIIENLRQAGFAENDVRVVDGAVYVGNDAEVSLQASREMLERGDSTDEQYHTFNLVFAPVPTAVCVNGAAFGGALSVGFDLALENYNILFNAGISRLAFFRVFGGPVPGCTYFINGIVQPALVGGQAGFPAFGAPFPQIIIGGGLTGFSIDVIEHVITHELGHTIGLRHSDFFNRAISCGGAPINEEVPPSGLGAFLIPGTPAGAVVGGSIMNSCFSPFETGEFTGSDVVAVNFLY
jgi:Dual-action HEIGH metallo-peptidase